MDDQYGYGGDYEDSRPGQYGQGAPWHPEQPDYPQSGSYGHASRRGQHENFRSQPHFGNEQYDFSGRGSIGLSQGGGRQDWAGGAGYGGYDGGGDMNVQRGFGQSGYGQENYSGYGQGGYGGGALNYGSQDRGSLGSWSRGEYAGQGRGAFGSQMGSSRPYGQQGFGQSFNEQSGNSRFGQGSGVQRRGQTPKGYTRGDERIKDDVCECLYNADNIEVSDVSVEVKDGTVTLSGTVPERRMKHRIEDLCEQCIGVKDVENRIRVSSSGADDDSDSGDEPRGERNGSGARRGSTAGSSTTPRH